MPVKAKAMATMSVYGAGGGALLGFASMAFGARAKSIAQGASLGLYAGILFGIYVIASYEYRNSFPSGSYPEEASPYYNDGGGEGDGEGYDEGGGDGYYGDEEPQYWEGKKGLDFELKKSSKMGAPIYLNLLNIRF